MKRFGLTALVLAGALATGIAFTACGGSDDDNDASNTSVAGATQAATKAADGATPPLSTPIAEGTEVSSLREAVSAIAKDFSLDLDLDSIASGAGVAVTFKNEGSATHTITFYEDEDYAKPIAGGDSGRTAAGQTSAFQFTAPKTGELYYRCEVHPSQMKGELEIE